MGEIMHFDGGGKSQTAPHQMGVALLSISMP